MAEMMKAVMLHKIDDLRIEEVPMPGTPGPDVVKVKVRSVGVCGSDVHYYKRGRIGDFIVNAPMILGHETAGEVIEVGSNVKSLKLGDRVAMEPGVPCRKCEYCKGGRYNLCQNIFFWATPPDHGSLAEFVNHPADFCYKLPEGVSIADGAMIEPLAVGIHACNMAQIKPGSSVAVLGVGTIGQLAMQVALAYGATQAIVSDVSQVRLDLAKSMGAAVTVKADQEDLVQKIMEATDGQGVDYVLECSGAVSAIKLAGEIVKVGGTIVWIGMTGAPTIDLDVVKLIIKEARIQGVFRYANAYPTAINLVAAGKIKLGSLITARYPFDQAVEAIDRCAAGAMDQIKVMIDL